MHNMVMLIGRLTDKPVIEKENEKEVCNITIACTRQFKNEDGNYDVDFIKVKLFNGIATNTCEYIDKGDLVGIKGRLEVNDDQYMVIAEKISFLTSK